MLRGYVILQWRSQGWQKTKKRGYLRETFKYDEIQNETQKLSIE